MEELLDNAAGFIPAALRVGDAVRGVDVGSGVGIPGVFLAALLPHSSWTLVDSNERRCDLARNAASVLDLTERVTVIHGRIDDLAHDSEHRGGYDLVVCRLFAAPPETAECCVPLMNSRGSLVVSCSSDGLAQWRSGGLSAIGAHVSDSWSLPAGTYVRITRVGELDSKYPRRVAARRRDPLF